MLSRALTAALALLSATALRAQEPPPAALPAEVVDEVVRLFNDAGTVRLTGPTTLAATDTLRSDVAALGGPLVVAGHVEGALVVVNGDLRFLPGASVDGGVLVVGGSIRGAEAATLAGGVRVHPEPLRYRRVGFRIVADPDAPLRDAGWGRSDFLIATGKSYNRVEGLPITFGPRIRTASSNPLSADALAIYRTENGLTLDPEEMGYFARVEQFIGGFQALRVGVTAHSLIDPIEDWQLSDLESGLSTFLLHRDYRDHYGRRGASLFTIWHPRGSQVEVGLEARRERHRSLAANTPWSLTDNAEPWRPQPLVAEGTVTSLTGSAVFDSRSSAVDPSTGWYVDARLEQAFRSTLTRPATFAEISVPEGSQIVPADEPHPYGLFSRATIDVRRYNRVDPTSRLNFRLLAGGSLDGDRLPPQRQFALGGEGSIPGYPLFQMDCGARSGPVYRDPAGGSPYFTQYGCDAFALVQAEYRGKFSFRFLWDSVPWADEPEDEEWSFVYDLSPDWTFFVDAGRAWSYDGGPDEALAADVGFGILVNRIGLFLAVPVTGGDGVNLFARIGPRF